jgi:hypothetical protein
MEYESASNRMVFESEEITSLGNWSASSIQTGERRVGVPEVLRYAGTIGGQPAATIQKGCSKAGTVSIRVFGGDSEKKGASGLG